MFEKTKNKELTIRNETEKETVETLKDFQLSHLEKWGESWNHHSLVTLQRQTLSRILYYNQIYQNIIGVPGCILEFGVQWGATLSH